MNATTVDTNWDHLYPVFRVALRNLLDSMETLTGEPWVITEGYRSQERQTYLYSLGRTRPGKVVTWMVHPSNHGAGLGADVMPERSGYNAPRSMWVTLHEQLPKFGLSNSAYQKGDLGHVQLSGDEAVRHEALLWVERGFRDMNRIVVSVNGVISTAVKSFFDDGHAWLQLRPLLGLLGLVIEKIEDGTVHLSGDSPGAGQIHPDSVAAPARGTAPLHDVSGSGYVPAASLSPWSKVTWSPKSRTIYLRKL